jgi:beta-phosphoglucomutase-like phosphatase (HAD superfamily)
MGNILTYYYIEDDTDCLFRGAKMVVFNMTGTVVTEGEIIYKVIQDTFHSFGVECDIEFFSKYCKNDKIKLIKNIINHSVLDNDVDFDNVMAEFYKRLRLEYMNSDNIKPIDGSVELFKLLRSKDILVCLNTDYSEEMALEVIEKVGFTDYIDGFICSDMV